MALINCPECNKEVSDKAPACIHCGFPFDSINKHDSIIKYDTTDKNNTVCEIKGRKYNLSKTLELIKNTDEIIPGSREHRAIVEQIVIDIKPLDYRDRKPLIKIMKENGTVPTSYIPKYPLTYEKTNSKPNPTSKPKCPTCGSTDIFKLGAIDRAVSVGFLGASSNKINKTFECKKCKYTW